MDKPNYVELVKKALPHVTITGPTLLVERAVTPEPKTKSGLILSTASDQIGSVGANLPVYVHVLAVGAGYVEEDGSTSELDTLPGDILLVGQYSVKWLGHFPVDGYKPFSIGLTTEAETQMRWRGMEAFQAFEKALNGEEEKQSGQ